MAEPPPPAEIDKPVKVAVGAAAPLAYSGSPRGAVSPETATATFTDLGGQASGSSALPALLILVLGLVLASAGAHFWRLRRRRQRAALWHSRDVAWDAVVRQIEAEKTLGASTPSAKL